MESGPRFVRSLPDLWLVQRIKVPAYLVFARWRSPVQSSLSRNPEGQCWIAGVSKERMRLSARRENGGCNPPLPVAYAGSSRRFHSETVKAARGSARRAHVGELHFLGLAAVEG